jgi:hypothetical protein
MNNFQAIEWWELRGRGWVANIAGIEGFNPRPLVGQQVQIDRKPYTVRGVETFCLRDAGVVGLPFGLLVGER